MLISLFLSTVPPTTHPAEEAREDFIVSGSKKPQNGEEVSGKQPFEWLKDFLIVLFLLIRLLERNVNIWTVVVRKMT